MDGSVNIQGYIFVSALFLSCIFKLIFFGFANKNSLNIPFVCLMTLVDQQTCKKYELVQLALS